jgi:hypothetical protein
MILQIDELARRSSCCTALASEVAGSGNAVPLRPPVQRVAVCTRTSNALGSLGANEINAALEQYLYSQRYLAVNRTFSHELR